MAATANMQMMGVGTTNLLDTLAEEVNGDNKDATNFVHSNKAVDLEECRDQIEVAAKLKVQGGYKTSVRQCLLEAGFPAEQANNRTMQMRVRRQVQRLERALDPAAKANNGKRRQAAKASRTTRVPITVTCSASTNESDDVSVLTEASGLYSTATYPQSIQSRLTATTATTTPSTTVAAASAITPSLATFCDPRTAALAAAVGRPKTNPGLVVPPLLSISVPMVPSDSVLASEACWPAQHQTNQIPQSYLNLDSALMNGSNGQNIAALNTSPTPFASNDPFAPNLMPQKPPMSSLLQSYQSRGGIFDCLQPEQIPPF